MQSLEAACEEAEHILHIAKKCPQSVPHYQEKNGKTFFSINQKLRELYEEECARDSHQPNKHLKSCSHLLDKLVKREHLNTLIVNLYPGNKGYSIGIRIHNKSGAGSNSVNSSSTSTLNSPSTSTSTITSAGTSNSGNNSGGATESIIETMRWPYQEDELLRYIDNEELPPVVVDLLEASNPELFYSGCIIAEVRDYRQAFPHSICDTHHVLLRPTTQSLLCDVNLLTSDGEWSTEDRLALESQLVLATQGPLCLDPSPAVSIVSNRMQYHRRALNTEPLRRCAKKFSQVSVNRKRKLDQFSAHHDMPLHDFIMRRRARTRNVPISSSKLLKKPCENGLSVPPTPPSTSLDSSMPDLAIFEGGVDVMRFARAYERPRETNDCTPQLVEEYILETERGQGRIYHIKLSILQRPSNAEYLGELYVDRDYREGEKNGAACRFCLGTRPQANRYIQQFTEIFTEEGRKSVRITHVVPGQPTRVTCTAGMKERDARIAQQAQAHAQAQAQVQAQDQVQQFQAHTQQQLQVQAQQIQVQNPIQVQSQQTVPQQNQLLQVANQQQIQTSNHVSQLQVSNHIPTQQLQAQIQVQPQQLQSQHIHVHQAQVLSLSNSIVSPPPVTNIANVANISNSSINNLSTVTPPNIMNGTVVTSNIVGNSAVLPNVTNSITSAAVGMGVGVSSLTGITSQNSVNSGPASSLTSHHQPQLQSPLQPAPSQVPKSSSSAPRHMTNPAISALVTSLMNSAQQFQAAAAAAAQANSNAATASNPVAVSNAANVIGASVPNSVQVTSSSNNATMLSLLNSTQPTVVSSNTNVNPATAQAINQKILARKMTLNLLNSRLVNHSNLSNNNITSGNTLVQNSVTGQQQQAPQQQQQQPVRVTLSSLASQLASPPTTTPPPTQSQQAFTISSNNPGFTTIPAPNMGFTTVPISAANTGGANKATSQQTVTLNHSSRLVNSSPVTRRLSVASVGNNAADTNTSATGSNLGLSMPGLSALLAGTPSADNPIPGSTNSASSLLERLTASSATSGTTPPSPYTPLPSSSPNTQPFTSPSPKNQFLSQSPSPKNQQQQTHFPSPSPKPPATPSPLSSPPQPSVNLNLQGLSLASLQGAMASIPGLQNVQVSFPGLAVPISLSLNVSTSSAHPAGVIVTTLPVTTTTVTCTTTTSMASSSAVSATSPLGPAGSNPTMVLTNTTPGTTGSVLSLPVAQLMASGVKNLSQQNIRSAGPTASVSLAQGGGQSIQLVGTLQRPRGLVTTNQLSAGNKQALAARGILSAQRHTLKMAPPNTGSAQLAAASLATGNQVVTLTAQQQFQLALQKQAQFQQLCLNQQSQQQQQKPTVSPASVASKHRRRSNAADPNK